MTEPLPPARLAYQAYAASTGGLAFDGRQMPGWDELPERIQDAWQAAAAGVRSALWSQAEPLVQQIESASNRMTGAALVRHQDVVIDGATQISERCAALWQLLDAPATSP